MRWKLSSGKGIIEGLEVTLKHLFKPSVTIQYPDELPPVPPRYRAEHLYDEDKCLACGLCADICPASSIEVTGTVQEANPWEAPPIVDMRLYKYDPSLCVGCSQCVDVCQNSRGIGALSAKIVNGRPIAWIDPDICRYCTACVEACPTGALSDVNAPGPDRDASLVPCRATCPVHMDVPRYLRYVEKGKYSEAAAVAREKAPFPASLGRACFHPCESACRRGSVSVEPVSICRAKRMAADNDTGLWKKRAIKLPSTGKRVAVIGAGPAGLTAAYYLSRHGHAVTVFEALSEPGGMMRFGIPAFRLPRDVLKAEIDEILATGVELKLNTRVQSIPRLREEGYQAVYVAIGDHRGQPMGVPGEDLPRVLEGVIFLREANLGQPPEIGQKVAVVGGGNVAMDCARMALRAGAGEVTILYRRTRAEMPAAVEEIEEAEEEGVQFEFQVTPLRFESADAGVTAILGHLELGEPDASGRRRPVLVEGKETPRHFDTVLMAIGQRVDLPEDSGLELLKNKIPVNDRTRETAVPGVFAGGDAVLGPSSIVQSIAEGRSAAENIDRYLGGNGVIDEELIDPEPVPLCDAPVSNYANIGRLPPKKFHLAPADLPKNPVVEIEKLWDEETAKHETSRCMHCDTRLAAAQSPKKPFRWRQPATYNINYETCIFCGLCAEVCPSEAIKMGPNFELSDFGRSDLHRDRETFRRDYAAKGGAKVNG